MPERRRAEPAGRARPILTRSPLLTASAAAAGGDAAEDLIVGEGETILLSATSDRTKRFYREVKPKSADELRELLGVPASLSVAAGAGGAALEVARPIGLPTRIGPVPSMTFARMIPPAALRAENVSEVECIESREYAREATRHFIYGDSQEVAHLKPLIDEYLKVRDAVLFIPFVRNIVVQDGGVLRIAANTHAVHAQDISLYGTGTIVCDGPTTFDCQTFQGGL